MSARSGATLPSENIEVLLALLLFSQLAADVPATPGAFRHGQGQGECYRDGTLRGMEDELCRARLDGPLNVSMERDASKLVIMTSPAPCTGGSALGATTTLKAPLLRNAGRTLRVLKAVRENMRSALRLCRSRASTPTINMADLRAILNETDELIHLRRPKSE